MDGVKKHFNVPQILFWLLKCTVNLLIFGRGTGKTEGPGALFCVDNVLKMPRSRGAIICRSYMNGLEVILPALIAGWERLGYKEGEHFWCFKWPPEEFDIDKPHGKIPKSPKHLITWYNGSVISLVSMDRPATSNGLSVDWMYIDEARLHNYQKIKELLPILRGNAEHFGQLANHGSILMTTDRPRTSKEKWVLNFAKSMNKQVIDGIFQIQSYLYKLKKEKNPTAEQLAEIKICEEKINEFAKGSVYVGYASTIENIHVLGINFIKNLKRSLSRIDYQIQVLNRDITEVEGGFYSTIPWDSVQYEATDYVVVDRLKMKTKQYDCSKDKDLDYSSPIHIGCDYGSSFNCVVAAQARRSKNNVLSSFYVYHPELIQNVILNFCEYYKPFVINGCKKVVYHYDHTAKGGMANTPNKYYEDVISILNKNGFEVIKNDIGKTPLHSFRYSFWGKIYSKIQKFYVPFFFNSTNNEALINACKATETITTKNGFEKDKSLEKDRIADQALAPHLTDALDNLAVGMYKYKKSAGSWNSL